MIKKKYSNHINLILNDLYKNNIFLRQGWDLMPSLKFLKKYPSMKLNIAKNIQKRILHLPSSSFLKKK